MSLPGTSDIAAEFYSDADGVKASVADYYGKVLTTNKDLKTSACTAASRPPKAVRDALRKVPAAVLEKFYGCGNPIPAGIAGLSVLDLGCGSGRDCFVAAQLVGESGAVTGIDMTGEQLAAARGSVEQFHSNAPTATKNIRFLTGYIEDIAGAGVAPSSIDMIISNCVVNLSPRKEAVLAGAYAALKNGGEFYFSDVYSDRRLTKDARMHEVLFGECISGAMYLNDFVSLCKRIGFLDPRVVSTTPIQVSDDLNEVLSGAKFVSITFRLFKLPALLEPACEDYGQVAWYLGTVPTMSERYVLDDAHAFESHRPALVCGNTAAMLQDSWLAKHFRVEGNRERHFGQFRCGPKLSPQSEPSAECGGCS